MVNLAINGYGRIGRVAHRIIIERFQNEINVVAINAGESTDMEGWMYLLKYDTAYRTLNSKFKIQSSKLEDSEKTGILKDAIGYLIINDQKIPVFSQRDPGLLPWKDLNVDVVIESTGVFTTEEKIKPHLSAGAKSVILSAPFKDEASSGTFVLGVNLDKTSNEPLPQIISNASCTTNCIAPVAKIIEDNFGIEKAMMTTIHGYTSDQRLQDGGHKDYRRARAAAQNIIPTSTGATKAAAQAIPSLKGIFNGLAIRVPVITGSLADFTFLVKKETTKEEVNDILKKASEEGYKNILQVTYDPIVSSDIIGEPYSSIIDLSLTQVVGANMVKVIAWYDNEYGYANRLVEEAIILSERATTS